MGNDLSDLIIPFSMFVSLFLGFLGVVSFISSSVVIVKWKNSKTQPKCSVLLDTAK